MIDQIIIINLKRRPDRRKAMEEHLKNTCSIPFVFFEAIDGKVLNEEAIKNHGVSTYPHWRKSKTSFPSLKQKAVERYYNRDINKGEIACGLSHYYIWQQIVDSKYKQVLILEDDARPIHPLWQSILEMQLAKTEKENLKWDLLYLGRNPLLPDIGKLTPTIVKPGYSWTSHAYAVSLEGAKKLLSTNYLQNLIPLDEYLPVMLGEHPRKDIQELFRKERKLNAFALHPNLFLQDSVGVRSDIEE
ncbi:MAG: glycosyltransferase family 25 protein [Marinifilaceae bacterium]